MKAGRVVPALLFLLSAGLGAAAAWPFGGVGGLLLAGWRTLFLFAAFMVFLVWLPRRTTLPLQILAAMGAGVACGWLHLHFGDTGFVSDYLGVFGRLFILLLTVVILPLIFVSVLNGTAGVGDVRRLGALGAKTLAYFLLTSCLAVLTGLLLVNLIQPGVGHASLRPPENAAGSINAAEAGETPANFGRRLQDSVLPAVIKNPIMAGQNPLVVIFFAMLLGAALASLGAEGRPALEVFTALDRALVAIIMWVMLLAPVGVFALMARAVAELGVEYLLTLAKYFMTVMLGLGVHFCVLTLVICPLLGRMPPGRFLRGMLPAFQVGFSTSSSSATLPVSLRCVTENLGVNRNIGGFVLPIGATVNMDGTALYLSVASLFVAEVYGMNLSLQAQFMVFLTAVLASIGTAGIPGASIGLMGIIFSAAGIPVEGIGIAIGVDRLLDMSRTVVNLTGDCVGAVVVARGADAPDGG
ncbi:MAG: dicarboxylate/amino acid:cation symporter [Candidatus Hydrogenedens sp.]|nr:dicarboxylate/amino acid:cation symporter [Candidatus Hydrogenedentota bacterium]NLF56862.1 dicarboxylate/amino acid:cation symporter [Candidatus Hydrogenedens sp.]